MTVRQQIRAEIDRRSREKLAAEGDPLIPRARDGRVLRTGRSTSMARKTETKAAPAAQADTKLSDALLDAVKAKVEGVERVDPKSGAYYRLMIGKTTLGYVNPSKKGLVLNLATPKEKVPAGVEVSPGPNAARPTKFKVEKPADVKTAVRLIELAVPAPTVAA